MPRVTHRPLSDQLVRRVPPGSTPLDIRDGLARGLILQVLPSGRKLWTVGVRYRGSQRRLVLGEYPGLSLAKARDAAEEARTAIRNGRDPAGERQAVRGAPPDTVSALISHYVANHVRVKHRARVEEERILNVEILSQWKHRSVRDITRRDIRALIEPIAGRGSPIMANRPLAVIRRLLNYGVRHDWIDANPRP